MKEYQSLNQEDIQWQLLNGWLSNRLIKWLEKNSQTLELPKDELLLGMTESIQKIAQETINILERKTNKVCGPPLFIITGYPFDINLITTALKANKNPLFFCSRKTVEQYFETTNRYFIYLHRLRALMQTIKELTGGLTIIGGSDGILVGYYDWKVIKAFKELIKENQESKNVFNLVKIVIHETFHHFCYQTDTFKIKEMRQGFKQVVKDKKGREEEIIKAKNEIEKKYGVDQTVAEIYSEIISKYKIDELFLPFKQKIKPD
ncbi:hypothetical protein IID20_00765 [Patescibacteria group bacterium]|nr:hypothetical protein [Patescibacteria group bacterium]